jgi:hypothetical protein
VLEIIILVAACVAMYRIAEADEQSGAMWAITTLALCIGCLFIPLPFLRLGIAFVLAFVLMIVVKVVKSR